MSLFRDARPQVLSDINTKNGITLKMADVLWGQAQAVSGMNPQPSTSKNTAVTLRAAANSPYSGQVQVYYDRLSFATVFSSTPVNTYAKLRAFHPARIHDLIPALNDYYGLELTTDDIEDGELTLTDGIGSAVIKAKAGSLTWTDAFTVSIAPGDLYLDKAMTVTDLNGVQYPSGQSAKGQAEVYSYRYDASAYADFFAAISVVTPGGEAVTQAVVDAINEITGDVWILQAGANSLSDAKIVYNGTNSLDKPSNSNYDYIIEIQLSDACTNFAGTLRFHYNRANSIDMVAGATELSVTIDGLNSYNPANYTDPLYTDRPRYSPYIETAYNDYSAQKAVLTTIPWQSSWTAISNTLATNLAAALKAVDGRPWNMTVSSAASVEFNLYASWVKYNGPIANAPLPVDGVSDFEWRTGFTHVMLLLPPFQCQSNLWYGVAAIYYNA